MNLPRLRAQRAPGAAAGPVRIGRALRAVALSMPVLACACAAARSESVAEKRAETIGGLVRIVGAQAGIVLYCRKFYAIDDQVSDGLARTVHRALDEALGRREAQAAIEREGKRVAGEIEELGPERWCADQRELLNTDGVRVFLD